MSRNDSMYTCNNCEEFVTRDFVRVFGDSDDEVFGCPACMNMREVMNGAAASGRSAVTE
ncbi:hypothetical protein NDI76_04655 [Halogeometricum sp. S1BR25-6]|uniref:Small CPxCG-related zinc finger protein n=2 Tax=Halogeometricum salsisoli TaxID=2950536 RepID=A0ABU2GCK3_9EURY|nr:hypothetical protein [Halogeometricum sp. S1BR25-6]MDS0298024.1 hypothetical protein [Halogeometricum sp. S1BR25-6]